MEHQARTDTGNEQDEQATAAHPPSTTATTAAAPASTAEIHSEVQPAIQPDLDIDDEAYAESISDSYVTSIASEISRGVLENERIYPQYGEHKYGMPVDEEEMDRMDLQHRKYELVMENNIYLAPIGPNPLRILDLGTGTGIWCLDMADKFPSAEVVGVDIAPIQPKWVATNCVFEIDDIEQPWTWKKDSFDFIHLRDPLYMIRDWPKLLTQAYEHLAPGGYFEISSIYPLPMCDDGSMPETSGFLQICKKFIEASHMFGAPSDLAPQFKDFLRDAGFVDIQEHVFKMPASPWPKDKRLKQIGALELANVLTGANAFAMRAFTQAFGWTREEVELALVDFRRDVKNRKYHQYCQFICAYGRKPLDAPPTPA